MSADKKIRSNKKSGNKKSPAVKKNIARDNRKNNNLLFLFLACLATALVYAGSLKNGFTNWDDEGYVLNNPLLRSISFGPIFSTYVMGNYHPITVLVQAIEYHFFKENATGFHIVSLLLHVLNVILVFYLIFLLTGKKITAFISALLFGIHPLHVESVSWASAQKDLLFVAFYLGALVVYVQSSNERKYDWKKYLLVVVLFVLSLLSKAQAVTLPVVMVLVDVYRERKFELKMIVQKIPLFTLSVLFGIVAIIAQKESASIQDIKLYSWGDRIMFSFFALVHYGSMLIAPFRLSAYYPYPEKTDSLYPWLVYLSPLIVISVLALIIWFRKKIPFTVFGVLFFLVNIFLVLQLLPVGGAIAADRYSYLSFLGFFGLIGIAIDKVWEKNVGAFTAYRIPLLVIFSTWILFLFLQAKERTSVWKNGGALWTDVISNYPRVPIAYNDLGSYYQKQNRLDLAKKNFDMAINLQPDFPQALINRCDLFRTINKVDSAIIDGNHAVAIRPNDADPHSNRGIAFSMAGKYDSAMIDFNRAISIDPSNARFYNNRGNLYGLRNLPDSALLDYNSALKYDPGFLDIYGNRGKAYLLLEKYDLAIPDLTTAIKSNPENGQNYYSRMQAYEKTGKYSEALSDAGQASRLGIQVPDGYIQMLKEKSGLR